MVVKKDKKQSKNQKKRFLMAMYKFCFVMNCIQLDRKKTEISESVNYISFRPNSIRYDLMNSFKSPSRTSKALEVSCPVRISLTILYG